MKTTIKMFLHWQHTSYSGPQWQLWSCDMSRSFENTVCVGERAVEVEVSDDFDPRQPLIESLRQQKTKVLADAQMKATQIEERIQQLLCIEHKPETQAVPPCEHDWVAHRSDADFEECARCCETRDRVPA